MSIGVSFDESHKRFWLGDLLAKDALHIAVALRQFYVLLRLSQFRITLLGLNSLFRLFILRALLVLLKWHIFIKLSARLYLVGRLRCHYLAADHTQISRLANYVVLLETFLCIQRTLYVLLRFRNLHRSLYLYLLGLGLLLNSSAYGSKVKLLRLSCRLLLRRYIWCQLNGCLLLLLHPFWRRCLVYQFLSFLKAVCHNEAADLFLVFTVFFLNVILIKGCWVALV